MKVLIDGQKKIIIPSSSRIKNDLESKIYSLKFSQFEGFFLMDSSIPNDGKMYGEMPNKINKIFSAFSYKEGNMGVLLSGGKGLGKTMFLRKLAYEAVKNGIPVIKVDKGFSMLSSFISQIDRPVMWLFDEFEKNFYSSDEEERDGEDLERDTQNQFLSLLDGTESNHHLFVVTCNDLSAMSSYFISRPGRFYYHFQFFSPKEEEIQEYLKDNLLDSRNEKEILKKIVMYSKLFNLNYDSLHALVQEINHGRTFEETIRDLNIRSEEYCLYLSITAVNDKEEKFIGCIAVEKGNIRSNLLVKMYPDGPEMYTSHFEMEFPFSAITFSEREGTFIIPLNKIGNAKYSESSRLHKKGSKVNLVNVSLVEKSHCAEEENRFNAFSSLYQG